MSFNFSDIAKQGYVKLKSKNIGAWNRRWLIACVRSSKGMQRIEKYMDEKSAQLRSDPKATSLENMQNASRLQRDIKKHGVVVQFTNGENCLQFACDSDMDADEWVKHIQRASNPLHNTLPSMDLLQNGEHSRADYFPVYLLPSPLLSIYGECLLKVTTEEVVLNNLDPPHQTIARWSHNCIRRYGRDDNKFTFESGRHSQTGEGLFILNTCEGEQIYHKVHSATLAIASAHRVAKTQDTTAFNTCHRPLIKHSQSVDVPTTTDRPSIKPTRSTRANDRAPQPLPRREPPPPPVGNPIHYTPGAPPLLPQRPDEATPHIPTPTVDTCSTDEDSDKDDYHFAVLPIGAPSSMNSAAENPLPDLDTLSLLSNTSASEPVSPGPPVPTKSWLAQGASGGESSAAAGDEGVTGGANGGAISGAASGDSNNNEVIYEEKDLELAFRRFLEQRKTEFLEEN